MRGKRGSVMLKMVEIPGGDRTKCGAESRWCRCWPRGPRARRRLQRRHDGALHVCVLRHHAVPLPGKLHRWVVRSGSWGMQDSPHPLTSECTAWAMHTSPQETSGCPVAPRTSPTVAPQTSPTPETKERSTKPHKMWKLAETRSSDSRLVAETRVAGAAPRERPIPQPVILADRPVPPSEKKTCPTV